jgi:hypothetical protein
MLIDSGERFLLKVFPIPLPMFDSIHGAIDYPQSQFSSIMAASIIMTGMLSLIGYTRWHLMHFNPLPSAFKLTGSLQRGQTKISSKSGLIGMTGHLE